MSAFLVLPLSPPERLGGGCWLSSARRGGRPHDGLWALPADVIPRLQFFAQLNDHRPRAGIFEKVWPDVSQVDIRSPRTGFSSACREA